MVINLLITVHAFLMHNSSCLFLINLVVIFLDCCSHLYCDELNHNILAVVFSSLPRVSLVYLSMEMIQPGKLFLKFDCWLNKAFKNYKDFIQIMMSLFFMPINPRSITRRIQNVKSDGISYSWYSQFLK